MIRLLAVLCALSMALPAWAQVQATIDRNTVTIGQRLMLSIHVQGPRSARPPVTLEAFQVTGAGQSTSVTIANGARKQTLRYDYVLTPRRTGTLTIPSIAVDVGGAVASTAPLEVKVTARGTTAQPSDDLFITATVSDTQPMVGEQVLFTFRFYQRARTAGANLELPSFDGVLVEDLGEQIESREVVRGQEYAVVEIRKAIFPQRAGVIEIARTKLAVEVVRSERRGPFSVFGGRTETVTLSSKPTTLTVRPLPPAPAGFSGLVGTFKLKSEVSRKVVAAGESVTLSTTVSGPATAIPEPSVDVSDDFKVYDDKPATSTSRRPRGLTATKVFRKALVPSTPGLATIGPVKLVVYDTERASYRTLIQGPFRIEVIEGSGDDALNLADGLGPAGKRSVRVLGDDLLPNRTGLDALPFAWGGRATALRGGALLGPPGLYLALLLTLRRREHYASSAGLRRRKGALKRARAALKGADALSVTATLRAYVGDKLDREGKALTAHEVADLLAARGVGQAEIDRVAVVLRWETEFQYGGGSNADPEPMRTEVADLLTQLDRVLR